MQEQFSINHTLNNQNQLLLEKQRSRKLNGEKEMSNEYIWRKRIKLKIELRNGWTYVKHSKHQASST